MRWTATLLAASLALACAQLRYEEELAAAPAPARHAVHGQRLAGLMRGLERLRTERLPPPLTVDEERESRAELVAEVALAMAASAEQIPDAADSVALDADERREFQARADELRKRADLLAQRARERPSVDLAPELSAVEAACDSCHVRFRIGGLRDGG